MTFLLSGLWHGASWNYVLWGAYHGILLIVARLVGQRSIASRWTRAVVIPLQTAGMFGLTMIGWLVFRETDLRALMRDLSMPLWRATPADRQIGTYLFLLTAMYALPLLVAESGPFTSSRCSRRELATGRRRHSGRRSGWP